MDHNDVTHQTLMENMTKNREDVIFILKKGEDMVKNLRKTF